MEGAYRCRQINLKLNKDKCPLKCTSVQFSVKIISQHGIKPDPHKIKALMEMPPLKVKKNYGLLWV